MKTKIMAASLIVTASAFASENVNNPFVKLDESVISTIGYETTVRDTPKNVQIISSEEIVEKNYQNVTEILRDSPLITIREDEFGAVVDMRGSGLNAKATVQIMVDGVSINPIDLNHGTIPLNTVPVSNIEKVEILPGGSGVLYGDGATGGVVNIITKSGNIKGTNINMGARYGSYSSKQWDLGAGTAVGERLSVQINYSGADNETHRSEESYKRQNFDITTNYNITPKDKVTFKYSYAEEKSKVADMLTKEQINQDRFQSGIDFSGEKSDLDANGDIADQNHITRNDFMAVYEKELTEKLKFNLLTSYQKSENDSKKRELSMENIGGFKWVNYYADTIGTFTEEKLRVTPSVKYSYRPNSYFIAGYDYKNQKSNRDFDNFNDMYKVYQLDTEKTSHGGYVFNKTAVGKLEFMQGFRREWTYFDVDKLTHYYHRVLPGGGYVDTGLQRDKFKKSMRNDALELAVNYLYSDTGNVYTRYERSFRTPSPTEFQDKDGSDYQINNLESETNHSIEMGVRDYIFGSFVSADIFYTRTKGEIFYEEITHGKEWYYSNLDETERKGVEISAEQYFDKLILSQSLSYIDAKITKESGDTSIEGNTVPYAPKINFNVSAKYMFTEKFNTVLTLNYKDKYYIDRANKYEAGSNITTNLAVNYMVKPGLDLYAGINNLLDRKNYDNVAIKENALVYDPSASRNYYAGFRYSF